MNNFLKFLILILSFSIFSTSLFANDFLDKNLEGLDKEIDSNTYIIIFEDEGLLQKSKNKNTLNNAKSFRTFSSEKTHDEKVKEVKNILNKKKSKMMRTFSENSKTKYTGNFLFGNNKTSQDSVIEYKNIMSGVAIQIEDDEQLKEIKKLPYVKEIYEEIFYELMVTDTTFDLLNISETRDVFQNGTNLTGEGINVAVIDSGVDITHKDFGSCQNFWNWTKYVGGTFVSDVIESQHPYQNNFSQEFIINLSSYNAQNFSVRFTNISLEPGYDILNLSLKNGTTIGIVSDYFNNVTLFLEGDYLKIKLISDNSINDYGFYISGYDINVSSQINYCEKVIDAYDFEQDDFQPFDTTGHGTHVASTIASENPSSLGVAPDVKLSIYDVCSTFGCARSSILAAMDRAVDPNGDGDFSDKADIVSMSLGNSDPNSNTPEGRKVNELVKEGVVFVIAAGNAYPYETIGTFGLAQEAITVGATFKDFETYNGYAGSPDEMALFSSGSPSNQGMIKPDISAPGVFICAAKGSGCYDDRPICAGDSSHVAISGTSMATPIVSGIVALTKQAHPDWTPKEIKATLKSNAKDVNADYFWQGYGRVEPFKTISQSKPSCSVDIYLEDSSYQKFKPKLQFNYSIICEDFVEYNLYYTQINSFGDNNYNWQYLGDGESSEGQINLSLDEMPFGQLIVRLVAYDNNNTLSNSEVFYLENNNYDVDIESITVSNVSVENNISYMDLELDIFNNVGFNISNLTLRINSYDLFESNHLYDGDIEYDDESKYTFIFNSLTLNNSINLTIKNSTFSQDLILVNDELMKFGIFEFFISPKFENWGTYVEVFSLKENSQVEEIINLSERGNLYNYKNFSTNGVKDLLILASFNDSKIKSFNDRKISNVLPDVDVNDIIFNGKKINDKLLFNETYNLTIEIYNSGFLNTSGNVSVFYDLGCGYEEDCENFVLLDDNIFSIEAKGMSNIIFENFSSNYSESSILVIVNSSYDPNLRNNDYSNSYNFFKENESDFRIYFQDLEGRLINNKPLLNENYNFTIYIENDGIAYDSANVSLYFRNESSQDETYFFFDKINISLNYSEYEIIKFENFYVDNNSFIEFKVEIENSSLDTNLDNNNDWQNYQFYSESESDLKVYLDQNLIGDLEYSKPMLGRNYGIKVEIENDGIVSDNAEVSLYYKLASCYNSKILCDDLILFDTKNVSVDANSRSNIVFENFSSNTEIVYFKVIVNGSFDSFEDNNIDAVNLRFYDFKSDFNVNFYDLEGDLIEGEYLVNNSYNLKAKVSNYGTIGGDGYLQFYYQIYEFDGDLINEDYFEDIVLGEFNFSLDPDEEKYFYYENFTLNNSGFIYVGAKVFLNNETENYVSNSGEDCDFYKLEPKLNGRFEGIRVPQNRSWNLTSIIMNSGITQANNISYDFYLFSEKLNETSLNYNNLSDNYYANFSFQGEEFNLIIKNNTNQYPYIDYLNISVAGKEYDFITPLETFFIVENYILRFRFESYDFGQNSFDLYAINLTLNDSKINLSPKEKLELNISLPKFENLERRFIWLRSQIDEGEKYFDSQIGGIEVLPDKGMLRSYFNIQGNNDDRFYSAFKINSTLIFDGRNYNIGFQNLTTNLTIYYTEPKLKYYKYEKAYSYNSQGTVIDKSFWSEYNDVLRFRVNDSIIVNISNELVKINYSLNLGNNVTSLNLTYNNSQFNYTNLNLPFVYDKVSNLYFELEIEENTAYLKIDKLYVLNQSIVNDIGVGGKQVVEFPFSLNKIGNYNFYIFDENNNLIEDSLDSEKMFLDKYNLTYPISKNNRLCIYSGIPRDRNQNNRVDQCEGDLDGDGIIDYFEKNKNGNVYGSERTINTTLRNISIEVGDELLTNQSFSVIQKVKIRNNVNLSLVEFDFNFNKSVLDISNLSLICDKSGDKNYAIVRGLKLNDTTKTVRIPRTSGIERVCIKDTEIENISQISSTCNGASEYLINCDNTQRNGYKCLISNNYFVISGLKHSGVVEYGVPTTDDDEDDDSGGGGGGGGGSGGSSYVPQASEPEAVKVYNGIVKPSSNLETKFEVLINGKNDLEKNYTGSKKIIIKDKNSDSKVLEFDYDFSQNKLDLKNLEVNLGVETNLSYVIVKGIDIGSNTKTVRLPQVLSSSKVCIKDAEISSISQISNNCDGVDEYLINCNSIGIDGYSCSIQENYYVVSGLKHSGVKEFTLSDAAIITLNDSEVEDGNFEKGSNNMESSSNLKEYIWYLVIIFIILIVVIGGIILYSRNSSNYNYSNRNNNNTNSLSSLNNNSIDDNIKEYINQNSGKYSDDAIRDNLIKSGYPSNLVEKYLGKKSTNKFELKIELKTPKERVLYDYVVKNVGKYDEDYLKRYLVEKLNYDSNLVDKVFKYYDLNNK